jgi:hypothetical protein
VLFRTVAGIDGEPCSFHEITEIVVDEDVTDGLFPSTSRCGDRACSFQVQGTGSS